MHKINTLVKPCINMTRLLEKKRGPCPPYTHEVLTQGGLSLLPYMGVFLNTVNNIKMTDTVR